MALIERSDVDGLLKGGIITSNTVKKLMMNSFKNRRLVKSLQNVDMDSLSERLQEILDNEIKLEQALKNLENTGINSNSVRQINELLESLGLEKEAINKRLNTGFKANNNTKKVLENLGSTPLKQGEKPDTSNRATLGQSALNFLGKSINAAKGGIPAINTQSNTNGNLISGDKSTVRASLKIARDTYARDKEYQEDYSKDFNKIGDGILVRLDKVIDKLDRIKRGNNGEGSGGSGFPDLPDMPGGDKKNKRISNKKTGWLSKLGQTLTTAGTIGVGLDAISEIQENKKKIEPAAMEEFKQFFNYMGSFITGNKSNTNTQSIPPKSPDPGQIQNLSSIPGIPQLNTGRRLSTGQVIGETAIKTNETDVDVKPQATVIIQTKDLEIKNGINQGSLFGTAASDQTNTSLTIGALGGGAYPSSGSGIGAIIGSRQQSNGFTPRGMQRQNTVTNAFDNQPTMQLPQAVAGTGTTGGGITNPFGFSGSGTGTFNVGNMGNVNQLPGNVTTQTLGSGPGTPKFLGDTSGGVLGGLISKGEGGYGSYNKGIAGDAKGSQIDFSQMTVSELQRRQSLPQGDPDRIFAFGKYQVIPGTMNEAVKSMGINPDAKVTPQLQEEIYRNYLISQKRPEVKDYITGKSDDLVNAQTGLAKEFASVADPSTGSSRYGGIGGNRSSIGVDQTSQALQQERKQYQDNLSKGMKPEEAWAALSQPQGGVSMPQGDKGSTAGFGPGTIDPQYFGQIQGTSNLARKNFDPSYYGDPNSPTFKQDNMETIKLDSGKSLTVNKVAAEPYRQFLNELEGSGYQINSLGGYANRANVNNPGVPSMHAMGTAIDVNPRDNPNQPGQTGPGVTNLPSNVSAMAAKYGISWGGDWKSLKDTMHFEYAGQLADQLKQKTEEDRKTSTVQTNPGTPIYDPSKTFGNPEAFGKNNSNMGQFWSAQDAPKTITNRTLGSQIKAYKEASGEDPTVSLPDGTTLKSDIKTNDSTQSPSPVFKRPGMQSLSTPEQAFAGNQAKANATTLSLDSSKSVNSFNETGFAKDTDESMAEFSKRNAEGYKQYREWKANASMNNSDEGSTRQSAAPPVVNQDAPASNAGSDDSSSNQSDKSSNAGDTTKAVSEGVAPTLSEIPTQINDFGLAQINSWDIG